MNGIGKSSSWDLYCSDSRGRSRRRTRGIGKTILLINYRSGKMGVFAEYELIERNAMKKRNGSLDSLKLI